MEKNLQRKWLSLGFLAIIIPVGLLVSFRLTGVLRGPSPVETITAETLCFSMERPTYVIDADRSVQNYYKNDEISANFTVYVHHHGDDSKGGHYAPSDYVATVVVATSRVSQGFIESLYLNYTEDSHTTRVNFFEEHQLMTHKNLSIPSYRDWMKGNWKAYLKASGENRPKFIYLRKPVDWALYSSLNQSHKLEITMALVYWNLSQYKELVLPISLNLRPDSGSFEDATTLTLETYQGFFHKLEDEQDYYKLWLEQNHELQLTIAYINRYNRTDFPKVDLYLYDPEHKFRISDISGPSATGQITFTADSAGWWYIQMNQARNFTYYLYSYTLIFSVTGGQSE